MRRMILFGLLAAMALPCAAKRVTVAQLEQALTATKNAHKHDAELMQFLGSLELSERLTEPSLRRLSAHLVSGSQAALALQLLANQSAFLDPPASELPATPPPDDAAQKQMLEAARNYVAQTLPRLPNLLATRTINRYDDSPQAVKPGGWPVRAGLHLVDSSSREISVRDERENQPPTKGSAVWQAQLGLISGGEFGTTLGMILTDTLQGKVTWGHWEQTSTGLAAVFKYSVPKSASHYEVIGSIQRQAALEGHPMSGGGGSRGVSSIGILPSGVGSTNVSIVRAVPSYHGSIWLDPTTGTILRITLEADAKDGGLYKRADILVQYGPVAIGDSTFICPVRSLALSLAVAGALDLQDNAPAEWLNETLFIGYHRFAATTRIVPDAPAPQ
jgi:hypothetical protein